ncbi:MAG: DUF3105 domain-containing protein [Actinomycetota bacterium]
MAKKKRRSGGPSGAEIQEQRQKRLEAKRQARAEALERQRKAERRERFVRIVLLALLGVGAVWFLFLRNQPPDEIGGHELISESQAGEGVHTDDPVQYDSIPPVSGSHAPGSAPCGLHAEQIPNENLVHTLEHGAVGLLYSPDLPIEQIRQLEGIVEDYDSHMFSAPYEGMESPIEVVAWGFRMPLEEVDGSAIRGFIDEFREKGPEDQDCDMDAESPFVAPGDVDASPAPGDSPSPEGTRSGSRGGRGKKGTPSDDES